MNENRRINGGLGKRTDEQSWFDDVRIVDSEWIELSVTTVQGEKVWYSIPRRALFSVADETI